MANTMYVSMFRAVSVSILLYCILVTFRRGVRAGMSLVIICLPKPRKVLILVFVLSLSTAQYAPSDGPLGFSTMLV